VAHSLLACKSRFATEDSIDSVIGIGSQGGHERPNILDRPLGNSIEGPSAVLEDTIDKLRLAHSGVSEFASSEPTVHESGDVYIDHLIRTILVFEKDHCIIVRMNVKN